MMTYFYHKPLISAVLLSIALMLSLSQAKATISCAGYLPSSYFDKVEAKSPFPAKLVLQSSGNYKLVKQNKVLAIDLENPEIFAKRVIIAQKSGKFGVINRAGKVIVPFAFDSLTTDLDIATSFVVSLQKNGQTYFGAIDRNGNWIYPPSKPNPRSAVKFPNHLIQTSTPSLTHAHYDSRADRDYFLVKARSKVGLIDDKGRAVVPIAFDALQPLNICMGKPLLLTATAVQKTALITQNNKTIVTAAQNQSFEMLNPDISPMLLLKNRLDSKGNIISSQLIDESGKIKLASSAPITKLLYHQLYQFTQNKKIGFINSRGNIVLNPQFDKIEDNGNRVWVMKNGKKMLLSDFINLNRY